jgi:hypothetical protein
LFLKGFLLLGGKIELDERSVRRFRRRSRCGWTGREESIDVDNILEESPLRLLVESNL